MFKKKYGKTVYILIFLIFSIAVIVFLGKLFMPKYRSSLKEGGLTGDYYLEKVPHDLIFLGDCEVFENFSPGSSLGKLWNQLLCKAQPAANLAVILVFGEVRAETQSFVYNVQAMNTRASKRPITGRLTNAPESFKFRAVMDSMTEDESLLSYVFPFSDFTRDGKSSTLKTLNMFLK